MARQPRVDFEGAWHHVVNRGARRQPIFEADEHCNLFLGLMAESAKRCGLQVHAYALMPNHYHLLVQSLHGTLGKAMKYLGGEYTRRANKLNSWDGPIFRGRYKNQVIRDEDYLATVVAYIHLNPVRAGLVRRPDEHCWTSHRAYVGLDSAPMWLRRDVILDFFGGPEALADGILGLHQGAEPWPDVMNLDTGWLRFADGTGQKRGAEWINPAECDPEEALSIAVEITGSSIDAIRSSVRGRRGNPAKRFTAWLLKQVTRETYGEIGNRLDISAQQVWKIVNAAGRHTKQSNISLWITKWEEMSKKRIKGGD